MDNGYPQPEDKFGYREVTYDTKKYCVECGIGAIQKAPFRIKKSPKLGTKKLFELNWINDEIFVNKKTYESVFQNLGLETWPVMLYKKELIIEDTVQLKIPIIDVPLMLQHQPFEMCKHCGEKKYNPQIKGFFASFKRSVSDLQIFKCREYFGSGGEAFNKIFITQQLLTELNALNIKPNIIPVQPETGAGIQCG